MPVCLIPATNSQFPVPMGQQPARQTLIQEVLLTEVEEVQPPAAQQPAARPPAQADAEPECIIVESMEEEHGDADASTSSQPRVEEFSGERALYSMWKQVQADIVTQNAPSAQALEGYSRQMKIKEVDDYLSEAALDKSCSKLAYWRIKQKAWPTLS